MTKFYLKVLTLTLNFKKLDLFKEKTSNFFTKFYINFEIFKFPAIGGAAASDCGESQIFLQKHCTVNV